MDVEKFSDGFKLLCRFLKEVELYWLFREYQYDYTRRGKMRNVIPCDSKNIIEDFGKTEFTWWLRNKKSIYPPTKICEIFKAWMRTFHPECSREYFPYDYETTGYTINRMGRKIKIKYKPPHY